MMDPLRRHRPSIAPLGKACWSQFIGHDAEALAFACAPRFAARKEKLASVSGSRFWANREVQGDVAMGGEVVSVM